MNRARRVSRRRIAVALALAGLLSCLALPHRARVASALAASGGDDRPRAASSVNASSGRLVFASERDDNYEIYIMDADGSSQFRLTSNMAADREPSISRDGARVAFTSNRDNNPEIYVMNADGSSQTRLTNTLADEGSPAFSPDGSQIAFVSNRTGHDEIFVMNADGTGVTNLTNNAADDNDPEWSPDGSAIAFTTDRDGNEEVYRMTSTGGAQVNLSNNAADDAHPAWTPIKIYFQSDRGENFDIYSMNVDGTAQTRLTTDPAFDLEPSGGTGSARVAFTSARDGSFELYFMNADGAAQTRLTNADGSNDLEPSVQTILAPPAPQASTVQFSVSTQSVSEGAGAATVTVTRTGSTAGAATVDFSATGGTASEVNDFTPAFGTLRFAAGETQKTFNVLITENAIAEFDETVNLTLSNATGAGFGALTTTTLTIVDNDAFTAAANPIDGAEFFVRQHYADFLNRAPDAAGLAFWASQITSCGNDAACIERARVQVSTAFFVSIEFQETGFFVIRTQRAAFGRKSDTAATRIRLTQFLMDSQDVGQNVQVGVGAWQAQLDANKNAYAEQTATSADFIARYPLSLTAAEYVDALFATAMVTPTAAERQAAITAFGAGGTAGRAAALRAVADSNSLRGAEFRPAFVLMQYFGYLRRNPTDPPDNNDAGYQFWLAKLNQFNGDPVAAEMVKAFITSIEYRARFGPT